MARMFHVLFVKDFSSRSFSLELHVQLLQVFVKDDFAESLT